MIDFGAALKNSKPRKKGTKALTPVRPSFDLETTKQRFSVYINEMDRLVAETKGLEVKDDASLGRAVEMGTRAKGVGKTIEKEEKRIIDNPIIQEVIQFVKSLKAFTKPFKERLKEIEGLTKRKVRDYTYHQELERRAAERKAEEERQKLQDELNKKAEEDQVEPVKVVQQVFPEPQKVTRTEFGSSHQRIDWDFEIENFEELAQAAVAGTHEIDIRVLLPNEKHLRQMVAMGRREIPGVRIFEKATTVFRPT